MFILLLLSILATLAIAESSQHASPGVWAPIGSMLAITAALVVVRFQAARWSVDAFAQRPREQLNGLLKRLLFFRRFNMPLGLLLMPLATFATNWAGCVRNDLGLRRVFLLDELLILAPLIIPLVLSWWTQAWVDHAIAMRKSIAVKPSVRSLFLLQLRHYGGFLFAPTFFALFVGELAEISPDSWSGWAWLAPTLVAAAMLTIFPWLLCRIWPTRPPAEGPLRERLTKTANHARIRVRQILVWNTSNYFVNAAVVGFTGLFRYVLLTDALLERLSDDEIEAVFLHEAAHVRRRHLLLRVGLIGMPLLTWAIATNQLTMEAWTSSQVVTSWETALVSIAMPLLIGVYCFAALCWISPILEFDADLWASRFGEDTDHGNSRARYVQMLERLAIAGDIRRDRRTWLHPSINDRIALIEASDEPSDLLHAFQVRMRWMVAVFILLAAAAPLCAAILA